MVVPTIRTSLGVADNDCQLSRRHADNGRAMNDETRTVPPALQQCARAVCMVRPAAFGFNPETAASNRFQSGDGADGTVDARAALAEFDGMGAALREAGIRTLFVDDRPFPPKPDAVFPNNWVSFHADGTVVLYPMHSPNRRRERHNDLVEAAARQLGFQETRRIDLTHHESEGRFLEGTGSLVLDHGERVAYACRSPRTDEALVVDWCRKMDYEPIVFDARTPDGTPVYHTNVLLWIGDAMLGVGADWIAETDRARVLSRLDASGRDVIELDSRALMGFAGNMLEVCCADGDAGRALVVSATSHAVLDERARARMAAATDRIVVIDIPTIERRGGGSVRCMLAEVPL
ncbi:MAG: hypothetical protein RLZZ393_365 [Pseudomonadota bacterium]